MPSFVGLIVVGEGEGEATQTFFRDICLGWAEKDWTEKTETKTEKFGPR